MPRPRNLTPFLACVALVSSCARPPRTLLPTGEIPDVITKAQPEWLPFAIRAGSRAVDDRREPHLGQLRRLTTNEDIAHVAWSPDSRRVVVESRAGTAGRAVVSVLDLGTGALTRVSSPEVDASLPSFLGPGGERVVFAESKGAPASRRIVSVGIDGGDLHEVATDAVDPAPFLDGSAVVFVRGMQNQLFAQSLASPTDPVRLFSEPGRGASSPAVSSDRTRVAWVSEMRNNRGVLTVGRVPGRAAEGRAIEALSKEGDSARSPTFLPDSHRLGFASDHDDPGFQIYVVDLDKPFDGGRPSWTQLTFADGGSEAPAFSPDGRLVAFTSRRASAGMRDAPRDLYVARWLEDPW